MLDAGAIVRAAQALFGPRLLGLFAFGSRVASGARAASDLDIGVWLAPPLRRSTTWVPWSERFAAHDPTLDPTFFTEVSLDLPTGWLLEAVRGGVQVLHDPSGRLTQRLDEIRAACQAGRHRRRLFMGLPHWERDAS